MAGFYPDVPGQRMAYDLDGTVVVNVNHATSTATQLSPSDVAMLNDESSSAVTIAGNQRQHSLVFIFPELRDVVAYTAMASLPESQPNALSVSPDTTNGLDGTWTQIANPWVHPGFSVLAMRSAITTISQSGLKGIAFRAHTGTPNHSAYNAQAFHLYGHLAAGESPNRLRLWHPTLDEEVGPAYFDWGDVAQSQPSTRQFRVKNNSTTLTATNTEISIEVPSEATPTISDQYFFDLNGGGYLTSVTIPTLAPEAISDIITVQRARPANAALSLWTARIVADAASMA